MKTYLNWIHTGERRKYISKDGDGNFSISVIAKCPIKDLIIGTEDFRTKSERDGTTRWLEAIPGDKLIKLYMKGIEKKQLCLYIKTKGGVNGYDKSMQISLMFEQNKYKEWSNMMGKKIITIDDIPIRTNKAMQGIVFKDRDTHEEKLYCSHLGDLGVLVPPVHEGFIVYLPYDELYERYIATNRRAEPPGGLWSK